MPSYIPAQGDYVILSFNPQSGHEQKGRRPALVISKQLFNERTGLAIVCPITNTFRNIPLHIMVPQPAGLSGYIMIEQIKSVDFRSRKVKFVEKADRQVLLDVLSIVDAIIY